MTNQAAGRAVSGPLNTSGRGVHLGSLDALRGVAIVLVLVVHAALFARVPLDTGLWQVALMGQRGVELFYLVSAFTLFLSLDQARPERRPLQNFYLRRFFRIAPAFYLALLVELLLVGLWTPGLWRYPLAAVFLNGWFPRAINLSIVGCWSIAVETTFYCFVPFLHARIRSLEDSVRWLSVATLCVVPACFAAAHFAWPPLGEYLEVLWFPIQIPVFLLGIVAYKLWQGYRAASAQDGGFWSEGRRRAVSALLLICFAFLFAGGVEWSVHQQRFNLRLLPTSFSFVPLLLAGMLWEWKLLFNPVTRFLGKISYSMYLSHFFLLWAYDRLALPLRRPWLTGSVGMTILFFATLALDVPLSALLWRWVEQPGVKLGRSLVRRNEARPLARETAASLVRR